MTVDCVILAAGFSSRMGKNKMILPIGNQTVIERCITPFYDCCTNIIVVTGKHHEEIKGCLTPYNKVKIVYNEQYPQGMFCSVKKGLAHVESRRFFMTPGDYPLLQRETVHRMLNSQNSFAAPVCQGRQGHPILLDKQWIPSILTATVPDLRHYLQNIAAEKQEIQVDDVGVVTDVDTMEDYRRVVGLASNKTLI